MPEKMESKDGAALEFGDDQFNEVSSVFRSCFDPTQESHRMKESIRNRLPGTIKSIVSDKVLSEVIVETASGEVASVITTRSVEDMKLKTGDKVFVLIKATNVSLRRE